jgi:hypothetical protein
MLCWFNYFFVYSICNNNNRILPLSDIIDLLRVKGEVGGIYTGGWNGSDIEGGIYVDEEGSDIGGGIDADEDESAVEVDGSCTGCCLKKLVSFCWPLTCFIGLGDILYWQNFQ